MTQTKAWTYATAGWPDCLRQTTSEPTASLSPTQIQIQIHAAALNPVDIQLMNLPFWNLPFLKWEKGIGNDYSGTVLKAGANSGFKAGDEIFGLHFFSGGAGAVAEVMTVDTASPNELICRKPSNWDWIKAAAPSVVWLTAKTCMSYIEPTISKPSPDGKAHTVAVLGGSSSSGMYAIHLAKQRGLHVVSSCSGKNADFVKSMGADEVIDYTTTSVPERLRAIKPTAIIDCVGGTECIGIAPRFVTIVGDKTSRLGMGGGALYLTRPTMVLRWALGYLGLGNAYDCIIMEKRQDWLDEVLSLPVDKIVVDSTFQFAQVPQALDRLNTSRARGKVVIEIGA